MIQVVFIFFFSLCCAAQGASLAPNPEISKQFHEKEQTEEQKQAIEQEKTRQAVKNMLPRGATIAVVVNKDVITYQDIYDRSLLVLLTSGAQVTRETVTAVRDQVKKSLVDEKIQLQAAKEQKIVITDQELKDAVKGIAADNNMSLDEMTTMLSKQGISIKTLENRLKAQIAWSRTIRESMGGLVVISEVDIEKELAKLKERNEKEQYELYEIFLRVEKPEHEAGVKRDIEKIQLQLREDAHFKVLAQQFSQGTSKNGYLGWVTREQLDAGVVSALEKLSIGHFSEVIRVPMGYKIIYLNDAKKAGTAAFGQTQITYRHVRIPYHDAMTEEEYTKIETHITEMRDLKSCEALQEKSKQCGYSTELSPKLAFTHLPDGLQHIFQKLSPKQCAKPIRSGEELIVAMICTKNTPEVVIPNRDQIREQLMQERLNRLALREFNKIKAISTIEDRTQKDEKN